MERVMLLWDVLDDWAAAAGHLASCAVDELAEVGPVLARTLPMLIAWMLVV